MTPDRIRLLMADDEPLARERARRMLAAHPEIEIVGEAAHGEEALRLVEELQPDVLLLDIEMPGFDGLRLAQALDDPPAIIFSTAHGEHAPKAFDLEAVDYLLKPYSADRLAKALERLRRRLLRTAAASSAAPPARIPLENGRAVDLVPPEEITAAYLEEDVVFVLRGDGETGLFAGTLNALETLLPEEGFCRVSRRAVVNLAAVESLTPDDEGGLLLTLRGGHREKVTRRRARLLRIKLNLGGS